MPRKAARTEDSPVAALGTGILAAVAMVESEARAARQAVRAALEGPEAWPAAMAAAAMV